MKVRFGQLWFTFRASCFILLTFAVATSASAQGPSGTAGKPQKNPKLSTPLSLLTLGVKQETVRAAVGEAVKPPAGFSIQTLPKPLQDAIRAGRMHITTSGEVQVYIEVNAISLDNLGELHSYGVTVQITGEPEPDKSKGEVLTKVPTVQGLLPVTMINQVSALPFVRYIRLPDYGFTNTGSVESQGDAILQAAAARSQFGVDGTGIRVGVISGGIGGIFATACTTCGPTTATPSPFNSGDLPSATGTRNSSGILVSVTGGIIAQSFPSSAPDLEGHLQPDSPAGVNAEGTAMLEIVHDLAPGAQLYFANAADGTALSFEQAVNFLAANTDVVVDDESFFSPPFDGTSNVSTNTATALNTDTNPIRGYFTAVGNNASTHYEGQYVDSGRDGISITGEAGHLHSFQAVPNVTKDNENFGPTVVDPLTVLPNGTVNVFLAWNDPVGASTNDYDLFLVPLTCNGFDSKNALPLPPCVTAGAPVGLSTDTQTGTQDPTEKVVYQNPTNSLVALGIVIQNAKNQAAPKTFDLFVIGGGELNPDHNFTTVSGSVPAEADAGGSPVSVVSVGATDAQIDASGNRPGTVIEPYSSQGPTEATPQEGSRMKPDITATDGVSVTGAGGFGLNGSLTSSPQCALGNTPCTFFGTSAAAPHAAAIAALVLQALSSSSVGGPATERANLRSLLTSTAVQLPGISESVPNNIEGFGLLDALSAVKAARAAASSFSLSPSPASVNIAAAGQSGTSTIAVTAMGGFSGSVSFTCSVSPLPVNDPPSCFVIPSSLALSATTTSATATLKISTTAALSGALQPGNGPNRPAYFAATAGIVMACVFLLGVPKQRNRWTALLGLIVLTLLGVTLSSCAGGGGSSKVNLGTPSGSYTATVAASSGSATHTANVAVTVQ